MFSAFHLSFHGNCREAMQFYQSCFNGDLEIQLVEEAPHSEELPTWMKHFVLQAILRIPGLMLIGSDLGTPSDLNASNRMAIHLTMYDESYFLEIISALTELQSQHITSLYKTDNRVSFTDRYHITWIITLRKCYVTL